MATDAALATLERIWSVLEPLGYPLAVMGGISLAAWNYIRATRDIDILIAVDKAQIDSILSVLARHGCRPKRSPPILAVGEHSLVQLLYTPPGEFYDVQFDLFLAESELQQSAISRRVVREIPGLSRAISVLSCEDLILLKLVAGRVLDRVDAAVLLRENREAIDISYLKSWTTRLSLTEEYSEIRREAYPGEEAPPLQAES